MIRDQQEADTEERRWWRSIDPLVGVVGVTALIVYILHGFDGSLQRDVAIYSYGAQQVVEGVPPYVSLLNRAGPLAHFVPAVGVAAARAFGFNDVFGMRVLFMLLSVASVCVMYVLARKLFGSRLAGLAGAAALLSFHGFIRYATYGPREKTIMVLLLLCTLLAVANHRWFATGLCVSLATLVWQPVFVVGLAAALSAALSLRRSERISALVRIALGGMVPAALCVIYFVLIGAFREFIDAFLLINARYTIPAPFMGDPAHRWMKLQGGYGVSLWVIVVGLVALVILTLVAIRREGWRAPARLPVAAVGAACLVAVAWTLRDFNSWPDAFPLLPAAAAGIGGIAKVLIDRLAARVAGSLVLAWIVASGAIAVSFSITHQQYELKEQQESVEAMLAQLPPDASIQSIGAPQALVLSRMRNPTRHQMFERGLEDYVEETWPGGLSGFAQWIGREQPTIISLSRPLDWLRPLLMAEYRRAGRAPGWRWFVHRSVATNVRMGQAAETDELGSDEAVERVWGRNTK
ncbi:MAG: hypothetical protein ACRDKF_16285 [Actinomycetota bacterium]